MPPKLKIKWIDVWGYGKLQATKVADDDTFSCDVIFEGVFDTNANLLRSPNLHKNLMWKSLTCLQIRRTIILQQRCISLPTDRACYWISSTLFLEEVRAENKESRKPCQCLSHTFFMQDEAPHTLILYVKNCMLITQ